MKKSIIFFALTAFAFLTYSFTSLPDIPTEKATFAQKKAAFLKATDNADYQKLLEIFISNDETECTDQDIHSQIMKYFQILDGSTLEELSELFEIEKDAYGCWWVTVSNSCTSCYGYYTCAPTYRRRTCTKKQLENCGSYWSGKSRNIYTFPCC